MDHVILSKPIPNSLHVLRLNDNSNPELSFKHRPVLLAGLIDIGSIEHLSAKMHHAKLQKVTCWYDAINFKSLLCQGGHVLPCVEIFASMLVVLFVCLFVCLFARYRSRYTINGWQTDRHTDQLKLPSVEFLPFCGWKWLDVKHHFRGNSAVPAWTITVVFNGCKTQQESTSSVSSPSISITQELRSIVSSSLVHTFNQLPSDLIFLFRFIFLRPRLIATALAQYV